MFTNSYNHFLFFISLYKNSSILCFTWASKESGKNLKLNIVWHFSTVRPYYHGWVFNKVSIWRESINNHILLLDQVRLRQLLCKLPIYMTLFGVLICIWLQWTSLDWTRYIKLDRILLSYILVWNFEKEPQGTVRCSGSCIWSPRQGWSGSVGTSTLHTSCRLPPRWTFYCLHHASGRDFCQEM